MDAQTGRVNEAWRRAREAIDLGEARGWSATPQAAIGYLARAAVHVYRSELDRAEAMLERMRTSLHHSGEGLAHLAMAQLEARLLLGRGDPLTGLDVLRGATSAATHPIPPFLRVWGGVLEAELLLATGEAPVRRAGCSATSPRPSRRPTRRSPSRASTSRPETPRRRFARWRPSSTTSSRRSSRTRVWRPG